VTKRSYYGQWLTTAFGGAWSTYNTSSAILGLVIPVTLLLAKRYWPAAEKIVPDLVWQIPLAIFCLLFVARVFLAPYWIAEEQEQKTEKLRKELDQVPLLNQCLTAKDKDIERLKDQLTAVKITTSSELTAAFKASIVREAITPAHVEGNAIVLSHTPIPESVELIIFNGTYVATNTRGISISGRKIFLENIPHDIQLLDVLRDYADKESITVKYQRDFSAEELGEVKRKR
jgi:hypothetical protein